VGNCKSDKLFNAAAGGFIHLLRIGNNLFFFFLVVIIAGEDKQTQYHQGKTESTNFLLKHKGQYLFVIFKSGYRDLFQWISKTIYKLTNRFDMKLFWGVIFFLPAYTVAAQDSILNKYGWM
jgi:hypothetical protein